MLRIVEYLGYPTANNILMLRVSRYLRIFDSLGHQNGQSINFDTHKILNLIGRSNLRFYGYQNCFV